MFSFRNFSLSHKLLSVIMVTSTGALLLSCAVILFYDLLQYREDMSNELSVQADIIGANSTIALQQHNSHLAYRTLQALDHQPAITQALIYAKDGRIFASYKPAPGWQSSSFLPRIVDLGLGFLNPSLVREIIYDGERLGTIVIHASLDQVLQRWMGLSTIVGGVIFASSLFAFLLSNRLQAIISDPILRLTSLAQHVSSEKNYALRETKTSQDEIGTLIDGVNDMLEQIQDRDRQLQKHQEELEGLVAHRTAELKGLHRRVELILETAGEGILGLDPQGHATFVNEAASEILGWSAEELRGECVHDFIHHSKPDGSPFPLVECALHQLNPEQAIFTEDHDVFWRKNNSSFPVEYKSAPIRDEQGLVTGVVMTFRDVTEQKRFEAALFNAVQAAEQANQAKSRFLANMSHEIRTPMNGLLGMGEMLLKTPLNKKQRQFTESLHRSGQHLLHIMNDILDLSKIEADKLELETLEFSLHQTLEDTVQLFAEPAQKKGLEIICHIDSTVPNQVKGDPGRLKQILTNLLGNAIKFTSQGEVFMHVSLAEETKDKLKLQVEVVDTGIGIPVDAQSKIFEAFSQADSSTTRKFGGTGLGLTITKQLVERMGGELSVQSEEGKGSQFIFSVLLQNVSPSTDQIQDLGLFHDLRILLVEDNHQNQLAMKELFAKWRVEVSTVTSGEEAMTLLDQQVSQGHYFQGVFIDQTLPDMEGIELAEHLKANPRLATIPLVLLTPLHMTEAQIHRAAQAGLHDQILKPVRQAELYDQLCGLSRGPKPIPEASHLVALAQAESHVGSASILLAEDHQVNQEIVQAMADLLGLQLEIVTNGVEAIQALTQQSYDLVLMDWQMPELDGLSATLEIREQHFHSRQNSHLPIIAITAHTSPQDRKTCLDAGTDDVLPKPFSLEQFQAALKKWLPSMEFMENSGPCPQDHAPSLSPAFPESDNEGDRFNPAALQQIQSLQRPNTPSILDRVLTKYFINTDKLLADLQEGLKQADPTLLNYTAHTLKSSSANVGAIRLAEKCKALEHLTLSSGPNQDLEALVQEITSEYETVKPILATHCTEVHA